MFQKKLLALDCSGVVCRWIPVWTGDNLRQLSHSDLSYFVNYYSSAFLRIVSEYVYPSVSYEDDGYFEDYDLFEDF